MSKRHYWGYRINNDVADYFWNELVNGRLRQGWGFDEGQNLRHWTVDKGSAKNLRMYNEVKKGDILLIPRIHRWDDVTIVEATEDWKVGYRFEIDEVMEDYGHIFPARICRHFKRSSSVVTGDIRSSLRNPGRFWNMDYYHESIEAILAAEQDLLERSQDYSDRFNCSVVDVFKSAFDGKKFEDCVFEKMCQQFQSTEWEFALVEGLKRIYPEPFFHVERTGGITEVVHGTDITISFRSIVEGTEYVIAIQVKDYEGYVKDDVLTQINKAEKYFLEQNKKLIDKIVIITNANKEENQDLIKQKGDIKIIFSKELKSLLAMIGRQYIAQNYLIPNEYGKDLTV